MIKSIKMAAGEQKLALFVDDVFVYLSSPTDSLPELMSVLEEYRSYSGYKLNEQKTQVITIHYNPPQYLHLRYKLHWDKKSVKYLGIFLPTDLSKLEELNYGPLKKQIISDINRWDLIPYLIISSRIDAIRMNVLPRLLYLFESVPIEKPRQYFSEWDKLFHYYLFHDLFGQEKSQE